MRATLALAALVTTSAFAHGQGLVVQRARVAPLPEVPPGRQSDCRPQTLPTPTYAFEVDASPWQLCATPPWPFSATFSPDGADLFVPLFGGFLGGGGCTVARVDPDTFQLRGQVPVGESPEEVAFVTWPNGAVRYGFVSDSSSSTVTVFDGADQVVATIPLPAEPGGAFPTAFPFGVAVAPDQRTVYVGTGDGQGFVHAIDVATLTLDPVRTIFMGAETDAARIAFAGEELVVCATTILPGFVGSTGRVLVVNPTAPQAVRSLTLATESSGVLFPSPQDLAVDCDGTVWVAGFDMGPRVFAIDPAGPTLVTTVPTGTTQPDGKFQALGLSADGLLVVADFVSDELGVLDARRREWLETIDLDGGPAFFGGAQEVTFAPDGARLLVPCAASDNLAVFDL